MIRQLAPTILAIAALYGLLQRGDTSPLGPTVLLDEPALSMNLEGDRPASLQVEGHGQVVQLLPDMLPNNVQRSRHQRFIIKLASGQTVLITHNIDLAPRIQTLEIGDRIQFYGKYEWSPEGGLIHWTHRAPTEHHVGGWLKHHGVTYQWWPEIKEYYCHFWPA